MSVPVPEYEMSMDALSTIMFSNVVGNDTLKKMLLVLTSADTPGSDRRGECNTFLHYVYSNDAFTRRVW